VKGGGRRGVVEYAVGREELGDRPGLTALGGVGLGSGFEWLFQPQLSRALLKVCCRGATFRVRLNLLSDGSGA
jgi:hypothetical protein